MSSKQSDSAMPQLIGVAAALIFVVCLVPIILQWIAAAFLWVLQAIVFPLLLSVPALILALLVIGFFLASYIGAKNYFAAIRAHIRPEPESTYLGYSIRGSLIAALGASTVAIYLAELAGLGLTAFVSGEAVHGWVVAYFDAIRFPAFEIYCPCAR